MFCPERFLEGESIDCFMMRIESPLLGKFTLPLNALIFEKFGSMIFAFDPFYDVDWLTDPLLTCTTDASCAILMILALRLFA